MGIRDYFPIWEKLTLSQQERLTACAVNKCFKKGTILSNGTADCTGLLLIQTGRLRAYILSEEGREITIYRLLDMDMCLFSASCLMNSIRCDIMVEAEKDSTVWVIPAEVYKEIMEESVAAANYTNEVMASRFSDVMWLMEQIMWKSLDKRVASFLMEEAALEDPARLRLTHEGIAHHLGTHREVITRMLRYFQSEGMVKLSRGVVELIDQPRLQKLYEGNKM